VVTATLAALTVVVLNIQVFWYVGISLSRCTSALRRFEASWCLKLQSPVILNSSLGCLSLTAKALRCFRNYTSNDTELRTTRLQFVVVTVFTTCLNKKDFWIQCT